MSLCLNSVREISSSSTTTEASDRATRDSSPAGPCSAASGFDGRRSFSTHVGQQVVGIGFSRYVREAQVSGLLQHPLQGCEESLRPWLPSFRPFWAEHWPLVGQFEKFEHFVRLMSKHRKVDHEHSMCHCICGTDLNDKFHCHCGSRWEF